MNKKQFKVGMWVRDSINGYSGQVSEIEDKHCKFVRYAYNKPITHRILKKNLVIINTGNA